MIFFYLIGKYWVQSNILNQKCKKKIFKTLAHDTLFWKDFLDPKWKKKGQEFNNSNRFRISDRARDRSHFVLDTI